MSSFRWVLFLDGSRTVRTCDGMRQPYPVILVLFWGFVLHRPGPMETNPFPPCNLFSTRVPDKLSKYRLSPNLFDQIYSIIEAIRLLGLSLKLTSRQGYFLFLHGHHSFPPAAGAKAVVVPPPVVSASKLDVVGLSEFLEAAWRNKQKWELEKLLGLLMNRVREVSLYASSIPLTSS